VVSIARIERAQSHRARSASKKGTWPLPSPSFLGRALREHRRPTGCPPSSLFEEPPNSRLNLVQPIAQVALKYIGLGLHRHALGLELVLEQHQLGK